MDNPVCFLFGHGTTPHNSIADIEAAAERHYHNYGIRKFFVGNRGSFDHLAATAIKLLKKRHLDVSLFLLLSYHPAERTVYLTEGFDDSYYPPLENVPRRYAIIRANRFMIDHADSIICYVNHGGNAGGLLEYARRQQKKRNLIIENVAEK